MIQQFLTLQIYFFPGMSWNIELAVSDLNRVLQLLILDKKENCPFIGHSQIREEALLREVSLPHGQGRLLE